MPDIRLDDVALVSYLSQIRLSREVHAHAKAQGQSVEPGPDRHTVEKPRTEPQERIRIRHPLARLVLTTLDRKIETAREAELKSVTAHKLKPTPLFIRSQELPAVDDPWERDSSLRAGGRARIIWNVEVNGTETKFVDGLFFLSKIAGDLGQCLGREENQVKREKFFDEDHRPFMEM